MNCGLTNLDTLKQHLLAGSLAGETKFDTVLAAIGLSVAGLFDAFTNRKLAYQEDAEIVFTGNRSHYVLPRYPVVEVTSVKSRVSDDETWIDVAAQPWSTHGASGIIRFGGELGTELLQVQVIWEGGYWYETLEPDDQGYPVAVPDDAALLPADLRGAFLMQCEAIWSQRDKLGTGLVEKPGANSSLASMDLVPLVKAMLQGHVRYQLS